MAHEEWRDVVAYEGLYRISSQGKVCGVDHYDSMGRLRKGKLMSVLIDSRNGYPCINLCKDGKHKKHYIHRMIAEAFIPNPNNYDCVDHINGVRTDSYLGNLRWCTRANNLRYAIESGSVNLDDKTSYITSEKSRLHSYETCRKPVMRSDGVPFPSITAAAKELGCTKNAVSAVLHGKTETCKGYSFSFADK